MGCCGNGNSAAHVVPLPKAAYTSPHYQPADGSITFPPELEMFEIAGYEVDPQNPRRLLSTMPPCMHRITGVMLQKDGRYAPHHVCNGPSSHRSQPVTYDICNECTLSHTEQDIKDGVPG